MFLVLSWDGLGRRKAREDIDRQVKRGLDLYQKFGRMARRWDGIADALKAMIQGKGEYDYFTGRAI